jgi:uncharacterized protein (DUF2147 family)
MKSQALLGPVFLGLVVLIAPVIGYAETGSVIGLWKTIDDRTGKPRSLVRITEVNGKLQGKIEQILFRPEETDHNPLCKECSGARRNQPIVGMIILSGLREDGEEYSGGEILDPKNGKTYRCKMALTDQGTKLDVRGYIGISLLGRTQTWVRQE